MELAYHQDMNPNRRQFIAATLGSMILLPPRLAWAAIPKWDPASTWVFAVGILTYPDGENWAQKGRRDAVMLDALRTAGVPSGQISVINDKEATYKTVTKRFTEFLAKAPKGATLWFYFAGHGDRSDDGVGSFVLFDKNWMIPDLLGCIETHFKGSKGLLFADCCYSGNLAEAVRTYNGKIAYAALTSSSASTISTGTWSFTDCLIRGLGGQAYADGNGDAQLDFAEMGAFTEREMAVNAGQLSTFAVSPGFDPTTVFRPAKRREHAKIGTYVNAKAADGKWYPGRIDAVKGGRYEIKWVGYDLDKNEWVATTDTKPWAPKQHAPGTKVSVKWKDEWYPARVLDGRLGLHFVRYDGFDATWNEWVSADRLRLPKP